MAGESVKDGMHVTEMHVLTRTHEPVHGLEASRLIDRLRLVGSSNNISEETAITAVQCEATCRCKNYFFIVSTSTP